MLRLRCDVWFEYVRSKANIADLPSRGDLALVRELGATEVLVRWPPIESWLGPVSWWLSADAAASTIGVAFRAAKSRGRKRRRAT